MCSFNQYLYKEIQMFKWNEMGMTETAVFWSSKMQPY